MKWLLTSILLIAIPAAVVFIWQPSLHRPSLETTTTVPVKQSLPSFQSSESPQEKPSAGKEATADVFLMLLESTDPRPALRSIYDDWEPGSAVMLVEMYRLCRNRESQIGIIQILTEKTGQNFRTNLDAWYDWIWQQEYKPHPEYSEFKGKLYSRVDNRFSEYFEFTDGATIRLDEIRWGGVRRDGIPPLKNPQMISPKAASKWLDDSNVVFGVVIDGDARCYPKRILAWHEMFKDTIGGQPVCGAY